jgi:hypothetical protein
MYKKWYVEKRRAHTHECVKRCKMQIGALMAEEAQANEDFEVVISIDVIMSRSLYMYARQSQGSLLKFKGRLHCMLWNK